MGLGLRALGATLMAYLWSLVFLPIAAWLFYDSRMHRRRFEAAQARREAAAAGGAEKPPELHPSLAVMADVAPFFVIMFLVATGLLITVAYFALSVSRWFSLVDLGAFLLLLAAYGVWFSARTTYRLVE